MIARQPAPLAAMALALACATGCPGPAPVQPANQGSNGTVKAPGGGAKPAGGGNFGDPIIPTTTPSGSSAPASPTPSSTPGGTPGPVGTPTVAPSATPTAGPTPTTFKFFAGDLPISQNAGAGGGAVAALSDDGKALALRLAVVGATGDLTGAHVRLGASGMSGLSVHDFAVAADKRSATTSWTSTSAAPLSDERLQQLRTGALYVAVDTGLNPDGEARGQLTAFSQAFLATLEPSGGVSAPNARGVAWAGIDAANKLTIKLYTAGLTGPLDAAHVHVGGANEAGTAVVKDLVLGADRKTASVTWSTSDASQPLTQAHLDALRAGRLYVDGHTPQNATGELRGQLLLP